MLPTLVPIPRPVRLRKGRFTAPVFVGWLIYGLMGCALYDVLRPLWVMFVLCTKGHSLDTLPVPPWDSMLGLSPTTPVSCLIQIAVAGAAMFFLNRLGEVIVWRGQHEKKLLIGGRAMNAEVVRTRSQGKKHYVTYIIQRDGKAEDHESPCSTPRNVGDQVLVLFAFDFSSAILYEMCRYEINR
ncbi:MAG: hypothetical protein U0931_33905 [Vulcanimicrobiota bacterium]